MAYGAYAHTLRNDQEIAVIFASSGLESNIINEIKTLLKSFMIDI